MDIKQLGMLMIGSVPPPVHGVSLYLHRLLNSSLKRTVRLVHFDISDHRDLANIGSFDLRNIFLASKQMIRLLGRLFSNRYDFVYVPIYMNFAGFLRDSFFIFIVKLFSRAKILPHLHCDRMNYFYKDATLLYKFYIDFSLKRFDEVIVLSQGMKKDLRRWFTDENMHVVSNGLDIQWDIHRKKTLNKNVKLTFLGNLVPKKGVLEVIKTFKLISRDFPYVLLTMGGQWNQKYAHFNKKISDYIRAHHLSDRIDFIRVDGEKEKIKFFSETDVFFFPSWTEGMPTVIIEAMAAGCSIVSTNVGSIPEMVDDGNNGFLLKAGDIQGMADKLRFLLNHPGEIVRMGEESKKIYLDRFTFKRVQQDFELLLGLDQ